MDEASQLIADFKRKKMHSCKCQMADCGMHFLSRDAKATLCYRCSNEIWEKMTAEAMQRKGY